MSRSEFTCVDLFSGCGGLTLGMQRAGFHVLAAIDCDAVAIDTLRANLIERHHPGRIPVSRALPRDLSQFGPAELALLLDVSCVDVIVGGPPCQGFSTARQVDGANHGARLTPDPRRDLYRHFLRYVDFFQPRVFVLENVLGIRSASGGEYFTRVQKEARELGLAAGHPGYRVHPQVEDAWELGVPQKRHRQLIIGVRNDLPGYFLPDLDPAPRAQRRPCLGVALGDLPILRSGGGRDERDYDIARRTEHILNCDDAARNYLLKVLEIERATKLTNHVARPHSDRDLRDFARLKEGENSKEAMRDRGVAFEFPYKKDHFKDRYTRQSRSQPCSTIVAHLSKDGLMFIHPTQTRSLTPREAARVQSFPDWFRFPASRTHAFRLIGNAVPPLVAEAVGLAVKDFLREAQALGAKCDESCREHSGTHRTVRCSADRNTRTACIPGSPKEAEHSLEWLIHMSRRALSTLPVEDFLRGWHATLYLLPGLHPDSTLDHGHVIETVPAGQLALSSVEELLSRRYARSGWPVALELIGREAWRRYEVGEITEKEFYCVEAQRAGLGRKNPGTASTRRRIS
ncbi:MAG TPA: DNA cytosine methyltransferase [Sedimentisphaerales bacterium]|nr:DNA cytosine methyltransferase [Sedimentisphaerales bacterium]